MKYKICATLLFVSNSLFAIVCEDLGDFKQFNGHYYTVTKSVLEFDAAKTIATKSNGYLAIPNNSSENDFLKGLISSDEYGWIGIYDPTNSTDYCYDSTSCKTDSSRFRDVKDNLPLTYENWYLKEPNNLFKPNDVFNGKQLVNPLGEHWVGIHGATGKWSDMGNHADELNNPIKFKAIFEFETKPVCVEPKSTFTDELKNKKCNTQVWDTKTGVLESGSTFDCQKDIYNNDYCPSALAEASEQWDYEDGSSVAGHGKVTDYKDKVTTTTTTTKPLDWVRVFYSASGSSLMNSNYFSPGSGFYNGFWLGKYKHPLRLNVRTAGYDTILRLSKGEYKTAVYGNYKVGAQFHKTYGHNHRTFYYKNLTVWEKKCTGIIKDGNCIETITITKCPDGYSETSGADIKNGECKKTLEYTYYNYICTAEKNKQGYNFKPINKGGDCSPEITNDLIDTNGDGKKDSCNDPTPPTNNCKREKFLCQYSEDRPAVYVDGKWQCSPFPCFGNQDIENLDTPVGKNDKKDDGWNKDGTCTGQIYIFNGSDQRCRSWDMLFGLMGGGCCDKDKVFLGLIKCKEEEKILAKLKKEKLVKEVGQYCSKKLGFAKICVQKKKSYCKFSSILARNIHEQGRPQLNMSWGSGKNPNCRGFTPEEFQKLDFSELDLSEFTDSIVKNAKKNLTGTVQNVVKGISESYKEDDK